ncbi:cupin domain-containing protein [Algoriphagus sp.]|uniref:cupin domain-containing protein n=1 Tax=Algoriphagus sp. TaxID=1872435 RepID=UPI002722E16B|nr:cupin domain-containing protein [Algoriphagus sp.]MDO8968017.1 cupin domain-containing protein [Algoriphagus sp.]MDP3199089.1 cupin domain-containing protein [Algoriphagus sp.]
MTTNRIQELVEKLQMKSHPEGGFYSETYRSDSDLETPAGKRQLITSIFFLLRSQDVSHFHRIKCDELWFWHEGSPLSVHLLGAKGHEILKLGPVDNQHSLPQHLVKAETIFGSSVDEPNSYSLVSCVVAPGFDFRDFELFKAEDLLPIFPDAAQIIRKLT